MRTPVHHQRVNAHRSTIKGCLVISQCAHTPAVKITACTMDIWRDAPVTPVVLEMQCNAVHYSARSKVRTRRARLRSQLQGASCSGRTRPSCAGGLWMCAVQSTCGAVSGLPCGTRCSPLSRERLHPPPLHGGVYEPRCNSNNAYVHEREVAGGGSADWLPSVSCALEVFLTVLAVRDVRGGCCHGAARFAAIIARAVALRNQPVRRAKAVDCTVVWLPRKHAHPFDQGLAPRSEVRHRRQCKHQKGK